VTPVENFGSISRSIERLSAPHTHEALREADFDPDPLAQFSVWMREALDAGVVLPNAMTLATATGDGRPSARMVLLKGLDARGFVFYTNYESRKARELDANPRAALVFYWYQMERQVRVVGEVERIDENESARYFATRPLGSRLSAWASRQSEVISSRAELEAGLRSMKERFGDKAVPLPAFWGGYRLAPDEIEFWQGMDDRLHDRLRYLRSPGRWDLKRLSP
jgi:pyridoxamine 5'-phosphate oxidase